MDKKQSQYRGVVFIKRSGGKWWARHQSKGNQVDLGYFNSEHEAAVELIKLRISFEQDELKRAEQNLSVERSHAKFLTESKAYVESNTPGLADYATRNPGTTMSGL